MYFAKVQKNIVIPNDFYELQVLRLFCNILVINNS